MKGLYIHIPFCVRKCAYCNFVSITNGEEIFDKYITAVLDEARQYSGEEADTVFIGGGTPTVLPPKLISRLLDGIRGIFKISSNAEITSEANPGTITPEKISALTGGGVNRLSIGVQSFNDSELRTIGRIHDAKTAYNTVCNMRQFSNINIDLMTSLPNQTWESLKRTLETAMTLPITHISAYSLILEKGTPLKRAYDSKKIILPNEDEDREMYANTVEFLREHGFNRYEISNFAKPGFECRHNIKYWSCDEYIGLGAAAHSYIGKERFSNSNDVNKYITDNKTERITLTLEDEISEFMMMSLRKSEGVSETEFKKRFGKSIETVFKKELERFVDLGLIKHENGSYSLTDKGIDVSNAVMCEFMLCI